MGLRDISAFFSQHELTRSDRIGAWRRFLGWQIASRLQPEVIVPWIHGVRLAVRRGMTGATGNIYAGLHEFPDMMLLLHFLRPGDLFLDVGANIGSYSLLAAGVRGAVVHAFEPDPRTAQSLRRNVDVNRLSENVHVQQCALGSENGSAQFTVGLDTMNHISAAGSPDSPRETQVVEIQRADDAMAGLEPAFMKIDVEGHEDAVIDGAQHILAGPALKVVEIETVTAHTAGRLREHGFETFCYDPFARALVRQPKGNARHNTFFIRDLDFVRQRLSSATPVSVFGRKI
jgi:FkbM family methyltransferase